METREYKFKIGGVFTPRDVITIREFLAIGRTTKLPKPKNGQAFTFALQEDEESIELVEEFLREMITPLIGRAFSKIALPTSERYGRGVLFQCVRSTTIKDSNWVRETVFDVNEEGEPTCKLEELLSEKQRAKLVDKAFLLSGNGGVPIFQIKNV